MKTKLILLFLSAMYICLNVHAQSNTSKPNALKQDSVAKDSVWVLHDFRFDDKVLNQSPPRNSTGSWEDELRIFSYELSSWLKEIQQEEEVQMLKNELRKAWQAVKVEIDSTKAYLHSDEFNQKLEKHNINWRPYPAAKADEDVAFKTKVKRTVKVTTPSTEMLATFNKKSSFDLLNLSNFELVPMRSNGIIKVQFSTDSPESISYLLMGQKGEVIEEASLRNASKKYSFELITSDLEKGNYLLEIKQKKRVLYKLILVE